MSNSLNENIVYDLCIDAYRRFNLTPPKAVNKDITRTYQWRSIQKLTSNLNAANFDVESAKKFISVSLSNAYKKKMLKKGFALFLQHNLNDIYNNEVDVINKSNDSVVQTLMKNKLWFDNNVHDDLLFRPSHRVYCNITKWFNQGHLSDVFIALSRSCGKALLELASIDPNERSSLPSMSKIFQYRNRFLSDPLVYNQIKSIMSSDLVSY